LQTQACGITLSQDVLGLDLWDVRPQ
jgi:hypothetical protein